jgi:hypothetical protein
VALYIATGIETNPKLIDPLQIARAIALHLLASEYPFGTQLSPVAVLGELALEIVDPAPRVPSCPVS